MHIERDVKEIVGALMRLLAGDELTQDEATDLSFQAEGELQSALNEAFIKLMEFAYDREARSSDRALDRARRSELQECLDRIVDICERASRRPGRGPRDDGTRRLEARSAIN